MSNQEPESETDTTSRNLREEIRHDIQEHLEKIGLAEVDDDGQLTKEAIRRIQKQNRRESAQREAWILRERGGELIGHFANGREIDPEQIDPELQFIERPDSTAGYLFRMATLIWSIPVSRGIGRRMRFLIRDRSNGKLIGLLALGSPVLNLSARDDWIGWEVEDREKRLVNVMDAYVLGAVPPYARLLGGKLVGALATSSKVQDRFRKRYGRRESVSGAVKDAKLSLITATSALGRSSLYNRLRLDGLFRYHRLGWTKGYGHFHIPESTFRKMRKLLEKENHKYASGHSFGDGPNWRLRLVREALQRVGLDPELLCHGIQREVFGVPLADNFREYLCGETDDVTIDRESASEIAEAAKERWIVDRAERCPDYVDWTRRQIWELMVSRLKTPIPWPKESDESESKTEQSSDRVTEPEVDYETTPTIRRGAQAPQFGSPHSLRELDC